MTIYLHADKTYRVKFLDQSGKEQDMSTYCSDPDEAERMCKAAKIGELETVAKVMLLSGEAISRITAGKDIRVDDSLAEFDKCMKVRCNSPRTYHNIIGNVKQWVKETGIGQLHPASVTETMVDQWINDPSSKTKASTRQFKLGSLRNYFDFLLNRGWSVRNPAKLVEVKWGGLSHDQKITKGKEIFTDEEFLVLCNGLSGFALDAVVIARDVGLRIGDICNLEFASFKDGQITVVTDKADTTVSLPTTQRVEDIVARRRTEVDGAYLFPRQREMQNSPTRRAAIPTLFLREFRRLGFDNKSIHSLRATYATSEYRKSQRENAFDGPALEQVSQKLGHQSTEVTRLYLR